MNNQLTYWGKYSQNTHLTKDLYPVNSYNSIRQTNFKMVKRRYKMANIYMKKIFNIIHYQGNANKKHNNYHYTPIGKLTMLRVGEVGEQLELSCANSRDVQGYNYLRKQFVS